MTEDVEAKLRPTMGAIARCSAGFLGLITSNQPVEVTYSEGAKGLAWTGVHLHVAQLGRPWSSRDPLVLFVSMERALREIERLRAELETSRKRERSGYEHHAITRLQSEVTHLKGELEYERGIVGKLRHFCSDWDYLCIDEHSPEFSSCHCDFPDSEADLGELRRLAGEEP